METEGGITCVEISTDVPPAMQEVQETQDLSLGWEDALEEATATYSSTLAWRIPWTEESGRLQ